jgi:hypothetical protein
MRIRIGMVVAIAMTVLLVIGVMNVVRDDPQVEAMAQAQACAGRGPRCRAGKTRIMRTPFFQEHSYRVNGQPVDVRCVRALYLVGDYACQVVH